MAHDSTKDAAKEIISGLPAYYPRHEESPNFKAILPAAEQATLLESEIENIQHAIRVQDKMATGLHVYAGSEYNVREGETLYRDSVTVNGTLRVDGRLFTKELVVEPSGEVINSGNVFVRKDIDEFIQRLEKLGTMVQIYPYNGETIAHYRARIIAEFALMTAEGTFEDLLTLAVEVLEVSPGSLFINDRLAPGAAEIQVPAQGLQNTELSETELADVLERVMPASYTLSALQRGTFTYITPSEYDLNNHDADLGYDGLDTNGDPKDNGGTYAGLIT